MGSMGSMGTGELPEDEADESRADAPPMRRGLRRKLTIAAPLLILAGLVLAAPWMVRQGDRSDTACSDRDYHATPGDSDACAWRPHAWLLVPKLVPWTRQRALDRDADVSRDQAERALRNATKVTPDAARRDAAADLFVERSRSGPWTLERQDGSMVTLHPGETLVTGLVNGGALAHAAREHATTTEPFAIRLAYYAALRVGDLETATAIGARADRPVDHEVDRMAGALACLRGEYELGKRLLARSTEEARTKFSKQMPEAEGGLIVCSPDAAHRGTRDPSTTNPAMLLAQVNVGEVKLRRLLELDRVDGGLQRAHALRATRSPFVAAWLVAEDRPLEEVLELIAPLANARVGPVSPYVVEIYAWEPRVFDPKTHERAAEKLEAMAASLHGAPSHPAPTGKLRTKPAVAKREEPTLFSDAVEPFERAKANPSDALRGAARMLWLEAATIHGELRAHEAAARDVARALAMDDGPDTRLSAAALALAAGDVPKTKIHLEAITKAPRATEETRTLARILEVFVATRESRWDDAHAAARDAHATASGERANATAWLAAAMAIRAGKPAEGPGLPTPAAYELDATTWEKLASMPEDTERKQFRLRMHAISGGLFDQALVMPAVFYVVGQAVPSGQEVFLDLRIEAFLTRYGTATALRARAEAARWRDDEQAAKELESRATTIEAMVNSPRTLLLAKLAGLM